MVRSIKLPEDHRRRRHGLEFSQSVYSENSNLVVLVFEGGEAALDAPVGKAGVGVIRPGRSPEASSTRAARGPRPGAGYGTCATAPW